MPLTDKILGLDDFAQSFNVGQTIVDKLTKLCIIGFSRKCFTADF